MASVFHSLSQLGLPLGPLGPLGILISQFMDIAHGSMCVSLAVCVLDEIPPTFVPKIYM